MSKEPPPPTAAEANRRSQTFLATTQASSSRQAVSELFRELPGRPRRAAGFDAAAVEP